MNALRHGLAITLPRDQKAWDELDKHSLAEIEKRFRQIERERVKAMKLVDISMSETTLDHLERIVRRMANLDRYSARAYSRLKKEMS